ncbi:MAG TPA: O-antigen ligase family protein [Metabacillus sp.]|nr:O-antigen ligase family protein [Metabacillus sp.]
MKYRKDLSNITYERLFLIFVVIQPLIDLATSFSLIYLKSELTLGTIIRFLIMSSGVVYLIFNIFPNKKRMLIYLFLLFTFFTLNVFNNLITKDPVAVTSEIKFILKSSYFIIMLFSYIVVFYKLKEATADWYKSIEKHIVYTMSLIGTVMVLSAITNTAFNSYQYEKIGHKGWFFAGNELGAIMSICFPITILYALRATKTVKQIYRWIPAIILVYSLLALGTKVGYGAAVITSLSALVMVLIEYFVLKRKEYSTNIWIITCILVGIVLYTPFSPISYNTHTHLNIIKMKEPPKQGKDSTGEQPEEINEAELQSLMLSGRDQYLSIHKEYFADAPISQKLLGMGYGGNYTDSPKLIEMDFHDLFFSFGIVGFMLYLVPIIFIIIRLIWKAVIDVKKVFSTENVIIAVGISLGFGIALFAGHVLTAPAVSIYLAILMSYISNKINSNKTVV